jgi:hypothetical protein
MADNITVQVTGIKAAMAILDPNKVRLAVNQTINRVATTVRKEASTLIRQDYNIKASRLNEYLRLAVRARGDNMEAVITGRGLGLALAYFDARQQGIKELGAGAGKMRSKYLATTRLGGRGPVLIDGKWKTVSFGGEVTARVKRSARKIVDSRFGHKPFMAQMKSGHIGVFERTGQGRTMTERFAVGVGGVFGSRKIMEAVKKIVLDRFDKEFDRQLKHYMGRK